MMTTCGSPGILLGTDDAHWRVSDDYLDVTTVIVVRMDGRMVTAPLKGRCPCCVAQWLYAQSTEMRKD